MEETQKYRCAFPYCSFRWDRTYPDGYPRSKNEANGKICPKCGRLQSSYREATPALFGIAD